MERFVEVMDALSPWIMLVVLFACLVMGRLDVFLAVAVFDALGELRLIRRGRRARITVDTGETGSAGWTRGPQGQA